VVSANIERCDAIMAQLVAGGVRDVVLCPGSRCTPLTVAAIRCASLDPHSHFDERGAAYFALGLAKASERPVALVCTSGTAVANFAPAVAEASAGATPLILLTADRPPELLHCGANQAMDQHRYFGSHARWSETLAPDAPVSVAISATATATEFACYERGPVQLNCQFREPFLPEGELPPVASHPTLPLKPPVRGANSATWDQPFVAVGGLPSKRERAAVAQLLAATGWAHICDITSGLPKGAAPSEVPAQILQLGSHFTDQHLVEWLGRCGDRTIVEDVPGCVDATRSARQQLRLDLAAFCEQLVLRHG
jgi:2-succinyl-5-enolpyruvyl-6-hydroxy-3-cyclohexene-1-carboxylate synthase